MSSCVIYIQHFRLSVRRAPNIHSKQGRSRQWNILRGEGLTLWREMSFGRTLFPSLKCVTSASSKDGFHIWRLRMPFSCPQTSHTTLTELGRNHGILKLSPWFKGWWYCWSSQLIKTQCHYRCSFADKIQSHASVFKESKLNTNSIFLFFVSEPAKLTFTTECWMRYCWTRLGLKRFKVKEGKR